MARSGRAGRLRLRHGRAANEPGAITHCCLPRQVRRADELCWSTESRPGLTGRTEITRSPPSATRRMSIYPDGWRRLIDFSREPWPRWRFRLPGGTAIVQELFVIATRPRETVLRWRREGGRRPLPAVVRPLISGRDYHALHRENPAFNLASDVQRRQRRPGVPYAALPAIAALSNGAYTPSPTGTAAFSTRAERDRGLDCVEDLASPGSIRVRPRAGTRRC